MWFCYTPITLRIYMKLVGTSRTDNDSTTNPENCKFLVIRGILGRSVIGVLRILTNPEICQFLVIRGIRGRSVIGVLRILTNPEICQFLAILGIRSRSVIRALQTKQVTVEPLIVVRHSCPMIRLVRNQKSQRNFINMLNLK